MSDKEFKIGEIAQFGFLKLKCVKAKNRGYCTGCYFESVPCKTEMVGNCHHVVREDKQSIIFVKVEE